VLVSLKKFDDNSRLQMANASSNQTAMWRIRNVGEGPNWHASASATTETKAENKLSLSAATNLEETHNHSS